MCNVCFCFASTVPNTCQQILWFIKGIVVAHNSQTTSFVKFLFSELLVNWIFRFQLFLMGKPTGWKHCSETEVYKTENQHQRFTSPKVHKTKKTEKVLRLEVCKTEKLKGLKVCETENQEMLLRWRVGKTKKQNTNLGNWETKTQKRFTWKIS